MKPHPVRLVAEAFNAHGVQYLLMGGHACIAYGLSHFTSDADFCLFCDASNVEKTVAALASLGGRQLFIPPLQAEYLEKGHGCHTQVELHGIGQFRVDVMSRMRNCPDFPALWAGRIEIKVEGVPVPVMGIEHLVMAKKTQRDKDWPMIRQMVETDYANHPGNSARLDWWMLESRTPGMLFELHDRDAARMRVLEGRRPLLAVVSARDEGILTETLMREELEERRRDREYWAPLKKELEALRHERKV